MALSVDIETYCELDLRNVGAYAYADHPSFELLLFGYAYDDDPIMLVDIAAGEKMPASVLMDLMNPGINKTAWNAQFERVCITSFLRRQVEGRLRTVSNAGYYEEYAPPSQWRCTAIHSRALGLPGGLAKAAAFLNLEDQKDKKGKQLIRYFCIPCKPTKTNGGRTRNLPEHAPDKWKEFKAYCKMDVQVERSLAKKFRTFPLPLEEIKLMELDQRINDRGILIDMDLAKNAVKQDAAYKRALKHEAQELAGIDNANSVQQLKAYLSDKLDRELTQLNKGNIDAVTEAVADMPEASRVIEIRKALAKTSNAKYNKMVDASCLDGRVRGTLQMDGAGTGRWAGRLIQAQNLPRNKIPDLASVRAHAKVLDYSDMKLIYGSFSYTMSQLIRTALIPAPGKTFIIADFSAIEARVIAWLADEKWRLDVFNSHGKIYEASASKMFGVPIDTIVKGHKNYALRAKGKVSELALGYQGGPGALKMMGALDMGLRETELQPLVDQWRRANPKVVELWHTIDEAAKKAVELSGRVEVSHGLEFNVENGMFYAQLPSKRRIYYPKMRIIPHPKFNTGTSLQYKDGRYGWTSTYGGKLTENIIQGIARDALRESIFKTEDQGYENIFHVHDEQIVEWDKSNNPKAALDHMCSIMAEPLNWAPGLPLGGDGFVTDFYMKD